jgi:hypothetical protein
MAHQPDHDCIHDYGVIAHQWAAERRPALDRAMLFVLCILDFR